MLTTFIFSQPGTVTFAVIHSRALSFSNVSQLSTIIISVNLIEPDDKYEVNSENLPARLRTTESGVILGLGDISYHLA